MSEPRRPPFAISEGDGEIEELEIGVDDAQADLIEAALVRRDLDHLAIAAAADHLRTEQRPSISLQRGDLASGRWLSVSGRC
jgi:hypothetical protein